MSCAAIFAHLTTVWPLALRGQVNRFHPSLCRHLAFSILLRNRILLNVKILRYANRVFCHPIGRGIANRLVIASGCKILAIAFKEIRLRHIRDEEPPLGIAAVW